jgi:hypothetical protein
MDSAQFGFHPKCRSLKLNHLCSVDDLLIFSAAEMASLSIIKVILAEFEDLSELKANPAKSTFFYSGVHVEEKKDLLELLQMSEGVLPIKYSRVPLITKRLSAANYDSLIAKISTRMDSWLIRHLSFVGRLILITSVLFILQVLLARVFILPKKVIRLL